MPKWFKFRLKTLQQNECIMCGFLVPLWPYLKFTATLTVFGFLYLDLFSAIEHVSHGKAL